MIYHLLPDGDWELEVGFLIPADLLDLHGAGGCGVKDSAAELEAEWKIAIFDGVEEFRGGDVEIEGARDEEVNLRGSAVEGRNRDKGLGPE
jgi:hypothetical protein